MRTSSRSPERNVGRAAAIGGLVGLAIVFVSVWLLALAHDVDMLPAVGLALFVGSWGGLGFGAMLGASVTSNSD